MMDKNEEKLGACVNVSLPDVATIWSELKELEDRHLVMEAHLIIEEYLDEFLKKLIPLIEERLLGNSAGKLNYEQKVLLAECFLERKSFLTFPKMVQRMRNKIVHKRTYVVADEQLKEFFEKLVVEDKKMVIEASQRTASKLGQEVEFQTIPPREQFMLLLMWFTAGLGVEIRRIVSGPSYEIEAS